MGVITPPSTVFSEKLLRLFGNLSTVTTSIHVATNIIMSADESIATRSS